MEMSKLLFILTEILMLTSEINSVISGRKCRFITKGLNKSIQITVMKTEFLKLTCVSEVEESCPMESISVSFYKNDALLAQLSEKKKRIEYIHRIRRANITDAGIYVCMFKRQYEILNTTIMVNITDVSQVANIYFPSDSTQLKKDQLYLSPSMKYVNLMKHKSLGESCTLECIFYSPIKYVSLNSYWIRHNGEFNNSSGTFLKSTERINITRVDMCRDTNQHDGVQCVYTSLTMTEVTQSDHAFFTCVLEARNMSMQRVNLTFSLLVDSTSGIIRPQSTQFEFNSNASVCLGQNFTLICSLEVTDLDIFLYKVHPLADLSRSTLYMNSSVLLRGQIPDQNLVTIIERKDHKYSGDTTLGKNFISYTLTSVSANDTGRYACVIDDSFQRMARWKSMHLSVTECSVLGIYISITIKYVFCGVSVSLGCLLLLCLFIIAKCKHRNDLISKFPIRKIILIEYQSPIYKNLLTAPKTFCVDVFQSKYILPDSDPILAPIVKIRPIKLSSHRHRGRNYSEQLPSTSTDRTRLESTRLSSQLENDVFECDNSDSSVKMKSELRKSTSYLIDSMYQFPHDHVWEFPRERLTITARKLGEGAFGMVFEGLARDICDRCGMTKVGVKMMRDDFSDSNVFDFVKEIETMKQIGRHRHVIQLLGVCTQNGPLRVIVELAPYGNLRDYLRSKCYKSCRSSRHTSSLSCTILCIYALQIARGMTYLASRSVVHRDLSARNILVGENYDMKIADFGLTRIVDYYYRKKTDGILPIKWMAPEALLEKKYTTKSDVWSYGILLWEIFSLGDSPYAAILPENVMSVIKRGIQNPCPIMATLDIYQLMQHCWHLYSDKRPHFYQIVEILNEILQRVDVEPEQNIYHTETLYLEMESGYMEPKESLP